MKRILEITLGFVTIAFGIGAVRLHRDWSSVVHGILPTLPSHSVAQYWFTAVSILGASITPYLFLFYSPGAVEADAGSHAGFSAWVTLMRRTRHNHSA